jgi:hypothetical protein
LCADSGRSWDRERTARLTQSGPRDQFPARLFVALESTPPWMASEMIAESGGAATRRVPSKVFLPSAGFLEAFGLVTSGNRSSICVFLDATAKRMPGDLDHRPRAGELDGSRPKRMSPARDVVARPLLRLPELAQWPPPHWRARRSASTHAGYWQAETAATSGKTTMMILVIGAGFQCTKTWATLGKKRDGTQAGTATSGPRFSRARARRDVTHDTPPGGPAPDGRSDGLPMT